MILFLSWLRTLIWFYVFRGFRNLNQEQIEFLEKSFTPQNKRDRHLLNKILDYNRNQLKQ